MYRTFVTVLVFLTAFVYLDAGLAKADLIKSYDFTSGLSDTLGNGVDLTASGGTVSGGRYSFSANQGLRLTTALPSTTDYGIEIKVQMNDSLANFNKLIDFQDLTVDLGLYQIDGQLFFYTVGPAVGSVSLNTDFTVGLARSGGSIELFIDGSLLSTTADGGGQAVPFLRMTLLPGGNRSMDRLILFESIALRPMTSHRPCRRTPTSQPCPRDR